MEKRTKKVSKKTGKKTSAKTESKAKGKKAAPESDPEKEAMKKKINNFINSDHFDKAFEALQVIVGKRDKEITEKIQSKMEELKVEEFVNNVQKVVEDIEQKGKKIINDLNEFFKK